MQNYNPQLLTLAQSLDMAIEAHSLLKGDANVEIAGVTQTERTFAGGRTVTIKITDDSGAKTLGRDIGTYTTVELLNMNPQTATDLLLPASSEIADTIAQMLPQEINSKHPILVAGLGNFKTTADAIGPKVISHIQPTRHIFRPDFANDIMPVAAITPGVLGNTGIETAALIKGVCRQINPAAVIVVDALAARKLSGVMHSIQICNTGIRPGSGVKNHRQAINRQYLGVPVLAIGIPTVVQAAAIIEEAAQTTLNLANCTNFPQTDELVNSLTNQMLAPFGDNLVMTPKEADELVPLAALIIAAGLTRALHPGANADDFMHYMQGI